MAKASDLIRTLALEKLEKDEKACPDGQCGSEEVEVEVQSVEEDDFWEALDMLESARNCMLWVLKYSDESLTLSRKRMMRELCDDVGHFRSLFLDEE